MKKVNLIIIATIIATFVISMFAFQPTKTEASNNGALPSATPSRKRVRHVRFYGVDKNESIEIGSVKARKLRTKKPRKFAQDAGMESGIRRKQPKRRGKATKPRNFQDGDDIIIRRGNRKTKLKAKP